MLNSSILIACRCAKWDWNLLLAMFFRQTDQLQIQFYSYRHTLSDPFFHKIQIDMMCVVIHFGENCVPKLNRFQTRIAHIYTHPQEKYPFIIYHPILYYM